MTSITVSPSADQTGPGPDHVAPPTQPLRSRELLGLAVFAVAACLVPLAYSLITHHIWEDYFITFRHSQNLVEGKGLLYNPPDRIHGFTSPLGVLLPALCYAVSGSTDYLPGLWIFRVLCILAFAGCGVLVLLTLRRSGETCAGAMTALALLYLTEPRSVVYTTNGMETAFMLLFLSWALYLHSRAPWDHWLALGICWAGLMWTRPDSPIYILALSIAALVYDRESQRPLLIGLLKSAAVCTVLYLPWFVGAWLYYGTPVPHTIVAKSTMMAGAGEHFGHALIHLPGHYFEIAAQMFLPIYFGMGKEGWTPEVLVVAIALAVFCAVYWILPMRDTEGRRVEDRLGKFASLSFALLCLYFSFVTVVYPWYTPPVTLLGIVVLVRGIFTLVRAKTSPIEATSPSRLKWSPGFIAFVVILVIAFERSAVLGQIVVQMRAQEAIVEMGNRKKVGEFLKENAKAGDRVYLEPLGYIGYFSGLRMLDWPGLVSSEVVESRRHLNIQSTKTEDRIQEGYAGVAEDLQPEWLVVRPGEEDTLKHRDFFNKKYELVRTFDVNPQLNECAYLPGRGYLEYDSVFLVYHKKGS
jgi:hypothetical protein